MPRIAKGNNFLSGFGTKDYLEDFFTDRTSDRSPFVNISESDDDYKLEIGLPGFKKNELKVELYDQDLVISGRIKTKEGSDESRYRRREFDYKNVHRSIHLPEHIDLRNITSKYEEGLLMIRLPKKEGYDIAQSVIKVQ